jgi:hypothetical protein
MIKPEETVTLAWCDNGMVDGKFTEGITSLILICTNTDLKITGSIRVQGNQIARQRQTLLDTWYDESDTDWLLWLDSDIVINPDIWKLLHDTADKKTHPIVSGIYFISKGDNGSLPIPMPVIFDDVDEFKLQYHHPLPENKVLKIDVAGMGLVVMHRSVVGKLRKKFGKNNSFFAENNQTKEKFIGEDVSFFRNCKKANIPLYAHTGAVAKHMKTTAWDMELYSMYWFAQNIRSQMEDQNKDSASE